jgi:hypothetical protein
MGRYVELEGGLEFFLIVLEAWRRGFGLEEDVAICLEGLGSDHRKVINRIYDLGVR